MVVSGYVRALLAKIGGRAFRSETAGPTVIGATGGSGTRVMARILRRGGTFMGTRFNEADDAIEIGLFLGDWIPTYIESAHRGVSLPADRAEEMKRAFHEALSRHTLSLTDRSQPYGWKEPR